MNNRIFILNMEISGVNKYLFSQLKKRGWELTIIDVPIPKICLLLALFHSFTPHIFQWEKKFKRKISELARLPWVFKLRSKFCQKKIKKFGRKTDVILQISGMFAPTLDYKNFNIPFVTLNDYTMVLANKYIDFSTPQSQMKQWLKLEKDVYKNAKFIFATSDNTRKSFINDYGMESKKVITVRYGVTLNYSPKSRKDYDTNTILFIGKNFKRKGGFVLLEAFKKVREEINDAELIIAGVQKDVLKIGQSGVNALGYVDNKTINKLYEKASVFVMPSLCEPFGLVFLEAMGHKLPCIGTTIDAMPEIIEDGITGFLVPPNNAEQLSKKIITLLRNPALCASMGSEGFKQLNKNISWNDFGEKIDYYLKQCLIN